MTIEAAAFTIGAQIALAKVDLQRTQDPFRRRYLEGIIEGLEVSRDLIGS